MHPVKIIISSVILVALIIGSSLLVTNRLSKSADRIESYLIRIEDSARSSDWERAKSELASMEKEWSGIGKGWSMLIDHFEIDNIDNALTRVSRFIESGDKPQTLAETATLRQYVKHIPEKESFNIKNIL